MKTITVKTKPPYSVVIGTDALKRAGALIAKTLNSPSLCVVVSPAGLEGWSDALHESIQKARLGYAKIEIPDGERSKTLKTVEGLMNQLVAAGADRKSVVIALGGGVTGDVAGFAASIFMRGVPVVQIPTTLLAQVDAAVGGKTGVDLPGGKNLAGTFHQPSLVVIDTRVLSTLPEREFRAGLFEVIKAGIIRDAKLFRFCEKNVKQILARDEKALRYIISAAIQVKADVVARDEKEGGLRRILNFGHTIGHAIEAQAKYKGILHGEAVAIGMIAASRLSVEAGELPKKTAEEIEKVIRSYGKLPKVSATAGQLMPFIARDKKSVKGKPHFVLLQGIGKTVVTDKVSGDALKKILGELRSL